MGDGLKCARLEIRSPPGAPAAVGRATFAAARGVVRSLAEPAGPEDGAFPATARSHQSATSARTCSGVNRVVSRTVISHSGSGRRPAQRSQRISGQASAVIATGTYPGSVACARSQAAKP